VALTAIIKRLTADYRDKADCQSDIIIDFIADKSQPCPADNSDKADNHQQCRCGQSPTSRGRWHTESSAQRRPDRKSRTSSQANKYQPELTGFQRIVEG
jgi:hypothetical protein